MDLGRARVVLRPRGLAEILDLAVRVYAGPALPLIARLSLLSLLPAYALTIAARWGLGWEWPLVWALALSLATLLQGLFTVAIGQLMFADHVRPRVVVRQYVQRLPAYFAVLVVTRVLIAVMCAAAFLVLPPLWMWGRCAHVHEACLLEQAGPTEAIRRAARIVEGNVVGAAGLLLTLSLAALAFVLTAESLINAGLFRFVLQLGSPFGSLVHEGGSAAALLGMFAAVPYWSTARFLSYVDLRTRKDGWDIQLRFMALAREAAEQEGSA